MTQETLKHIAIIMDGNGRWAKARGLPRIAGHRQGVAAVRALVRDIDDLGLDYLTLYGFSSENWNRPLSEVNDLMGLMKLYINRDLNELVERGVRVRIIGARYNLAPDIVSLIENAEQRSSQNSRMTLVIAFNYGGRDEIISAARIMAEEVRAGTLSPSDISAELFSEYLYAHDIPDPDLLIRTSGEMRLSNFLTWQSAYSELVFVKTLWPDFTRQHLIDAIDEYYQRDRRFGARPDEQLNIAGGRRAAIIKRVK